MIVYVIEIHTYSGRVAEGWNRVIGGVFTEFVNAENICADENSKNEDEIWRIREREVDKMVSSDQAILEINI